MEEDKRIDEYVQKKEALTHLQKQKVDDRFNQKQIIRQKLIDK